MIVYIMENKTHYQHCDPEEVGFMGLNHSRQQPEHIKPPVSTRCSFCQGILWLSSILQTPPLRGPMTERSIKLGITCVLLKGGCHIVCTFAANPSP